MRLHRRAFLKTLPLAATVSVWRAAAADDTPRIHTVRGSISAARLGVTLTHEHVLVDFIGADRIRRDRYNSEEVFQTALPHLQALKRRGCDTLVECTPAYLGRDPRLLRRLSEASGLNLLTNTGYYAAGQAKFIPAHAYHEAADALAARWTREFREGIEGTGIRPGFLKLGADAGPLSDLGRKLVTAAALCHRKTGLMIHVHTGDGVAAREIVATLRRESVSPSAYVWVHAQNEKDRARHIEAAQAGAWLSLDGFRTERSDEYVEAVLDMMGRGYLSRLLISQDAGWYHVGEPGGGTFRGYTALWEAFLPALRKQGVTEAQIKNLLVENPAQALSLRIRTLT